MPASANCIDIRIKNLSEIKQNIKENKIFTIGYLSKLASYEIEKEKLDLNYTESLFKTSLSTAFSNDFNETIRNGNDDASSLAKLSSEYYIETSEDKSIRQDKIKLKLSDLSILSEKETKEETNKVILILAEIANSLLQKEILGKQSYLISKYIEFLKTTSLLKDENKASEIAQKDIEKIKIINKNNSLEIKIDNLLNQISYKVKRTELESSSIIVEIKKALENIRRTKFVADCNIDMADVKLLENDLKIKKLNLKELSRNYSPKINAFSDLSTESTFDGNTFEEFKIGLRMKLNIFDKHSLSRQKQPLLSEISLAAAKIREKETELSKKIEEFYKVEQSILDNLEQVSTSLYTIQSEYFELREREKLGLTVYEELLLKLIQGFELREVEQEIKFQVLSYWINQSNFLKVIS